MVFILHAGYIGVYVTFLYDLIRIFRRVIPHKGWLVSLEDLGFWAYLFVAVFLFLNKEGNGTLRWFAVAGVLAGMILYKKLLGRHLVSYGTRILTRIRNVILKIMTPPIKAATGGMRTVARRTKRGIKQRLTIFLKMLRMNLGVGRRTQGHRGENHGKKKGGIPKESTE